MRVQQEAAAAARLGGESATAVAVRIDSRLPQATTAVAADERAMLLSAGQAVEEVQGGPARDE